MKQLIILFLIFFFLPVVLGKVSLSPFSNFFQNLSLDNFWTALTTVLKADWNFYTGWLSPWIEKVKEFIRDNIPQLP